RSAATWPCARSPQTARTRPRPTPSERACVVRRPVPLCAPPRSRAGMTNATTNPEAVQCKPGAAVVGEKGVERAIKHLKRKMAAEGILRELKRRRHYMKPSVRKRKKESEAARRRRKREKQIQER